MIRLLCRVIRNAHRAQKQMRRFAEVFGPPIEIEYERVKESTMGSYESAKKISSCYHDWNPRPALLFGYMRVDAQCTKCKTWWAPLTDRSQL